MEKLTLTAAEVKQIAQTYIKKAIEADCQHNWKEAVQYYTRAIELQPQKAIYYHERAESNVMLKEYELAKTDYDIALSLKPNNDFAFYRRAFMKIELSKPNSALNDLNKAILLNDSNPDYFALRAKLFTNMNSTIEAMADLTSAIKLIQSGYNCAGTAIEDLLVQRAKLYVSEEAWLKALNDFEQTVALKPDEQIYKAFMGICYDGMGMHQEADRLFRAAHAKADTTHDYYTWMAAIKLALADEAGALEYLDEGIELYNEATTYVYRAELKARMNDTEGAVADYRLAYRIK